MAWLIHVLRTWARARRGFVTGSETKVAIRPGPAGCSARSGRQVRDYAAARGRYSWILDPQVRTLEILELGTKGRYAQALVAKDGKVRGVPGCPGLVLDLDALWAEIDEAESETPAPREAGRREPHDARRAVAEAAGEGLAAWSTRRQWHRLARLRMQE